MIPFFDIVNVVIHIVLVVVFVFIFDLVISIVTVLEQSTEWSWQQDVTAKCVWKWDGSACCPSGCRLVAVEEDAAATKSTVSVWSRKRKRCC